MAILCAEEAKGLAMFNPYLLVAELTSNCNASPPCTYCHRDLVDRNPSMMELELYKKLVDLPCIEEVHPQNWGEPFLHSEIMEAIGYAKKRGKKVVIYTNGSLIDNLIPDILETKLDEIRFSIDGCDEESYRWNRSGLPWKKILSNVEKFQEQKMWLGYSTKTSIRICVTKENRHRLDEITEFWMKRADDVFSVPEMEVVFPTEKWATTKPVVCDKIYAHLTVLSNGDIVICCEDRFGIYVLGNAYADNPLEAYNSEEANRIRRSMKEGRNHPSICVQCKGDKA